MTRAANIMRADQVGALDAAVALLQEGKPLVMPTDSVYGIGVSVAHASSPEELFAIKHRPAEKAIPWLVTGIEALERYCTDMPRQARLLAKDFWPGALTLVLPVTDQVPAGFLPESNTLAFRMPDHPFVLQLMERLGSPLAVTSANISGHPAPTDVDQLEEELALSVELVVDGGSCKCGIASTVVAIHHGAIQILRAGAISKEQIEGSLHEQGEVVVQER